MADCSDLISLQDQKDAKVNADSINEFVNSDNPSMVTLEGKTKKTVQGIADDGAAALAQFELDANTAISAAGFEIIGDFSDAVKTEIEFPNQQYTSRDVVNFEDYVWRYTGELPYAPTESTPIGNDWVATAIGELETIARAYNKPKDNVIYGTVGAPIPANVELIFVPEQQTAYSKPIAVGDGEVIISIVDNVLETNAGDYNLYLPSVISATSIWELTALNLKPGARVSVAGRDTPGDGGEGDYLIVRSADYVGTPDGYIDIQLLTGDVAVRQLGIVVSLMSLGVKFNDTITSAQAGNVLALTALSERLKSQYISVLPWTGDIAINANVQFRENNVDIVGSGADLCSITCTNDSAYGFDLFAVAAGVGRYTLKNFTFNGKYCVKTRYAHDIDFENDSNPIKAFSFDNVVFNGVYDAASDPLAGSATLPTRGELNLLGIGLQLSVNYRTEVKECEFNNNGVGLSSMGNTLCSYKQNRFKNNARHLHDERTLWAGSSFGLGAENIIEQNDFLDATRIGGLSFINSFGTDYRNNYHEHIDRGGVVVSPIMIYYENPSHVNTSYNHYNVSQSVTNNTEFMRYYFNTSNAIGESSNNVLTGNRLTPFNNVLAAYYRVTNDDFDRRYPISVKEFGNSDTFPTLNAAYVMRANQADLSYISYNNMSSNNVLGGAVADNSILWIKDATTDSWHLPTLADSAATPALSFTLKLNNKSLSDTFNLSIAANDNATGNGRLYITVSDETGIIYNAFAYQGVTSLTTTVIPLTGGAVRNKEFNINLTDLSFSKVFDVSITN